MQVIYENLTGMPADARHLESVIAQLKCIHSGIISGGKIAFDEGAALSKYLYDIGGVLRRVGSRAKNLEDLVRCHFFPTIFRDAKPENWIISAENHVYMVDFDYLVPSGPLQDFAQFLTGVWVNDFRLDDETFLFAALDSLLQNEPWAEYFKCGKSDLYPMFSAAALLSISKKREYLQGTARGNRLRQLEAILTTYVT